VLNIQGRSYRLRDLEAELAASARAKGAPSPDAADSDANRPSSHTPRGGLMKMLSSGQFGRNMY